MVHGHRLVRKIHENHPVYSKHTQIRRQVQLSTKRNNEDFFEISVEISPTISVGSKQYFVL